MSTRRGSETLDTYLLKVFSILMAERSVSRTALKRPGEHSQTPSSTLPSAEVHRVFAAST